MLFKNIKPLRLPSPWGVSVATLESWLARYPFQPCESLDLISRGWVPPVEGGALVRAVGGQWMITLQVEAKIIPPRAINLVALERAKEIEVQQGYAPGRKQMREIKERVGDELAAKALVERYRVHAWIDPAAGWLCIDTPSTSKADTLLEMLGKSCDELPLSRLKTRVSPASAMADWLSAGEAWCDFTIDRDCHLKSHAEDRAAVRYTHHPLEGDEIRNHLAQGKIPVALAMTYKDRVSFVLTDQMTLKRITFLDVFQEDVEKQATNAADIFDAQFSLSTGELRALLSDLVAGMGGELEGEA